MLKKKILLRVLLAFIVATFLLLFSKQIGDAFKIHGTQLKYVTQGIALTTFVIIIFNIIRIKRDNLFPFSIGLNNPVRAFLLFLLGLCIFIIPILSTLAYISINELATVNINLIANKTIMLNLIAVLLFEAFPEEYIFRGYIYSNLNVIFPKWKAAIFSAIIFTLFPVILQFITVYVFKDQAYIGGKRFVTLEFLITLLLFGLLLSYLRILTKSIWAGVGFHLLFVHMNKLFGPNRSNIIQLSEVANENDIGSALIISLLFIFLILILYPIVSKKKLNFNKKILLSEKNKICE